MEGERKIIPVVLGFADSCGICGKNSRKPEKPKGQGLA
jgi:hypothetical protein